MKKKDILLAYANIVKNINGDSVIRLSKPIKIEKNESEDENVWGTEEHLIPEGEYDEIYEGNCKDFLENFNGKESETGLYRVMDYEEMEDGTVGGVKLDFIW
jgi:hypothetical protein